jgi:Bacterial lectin/Divergent InlB B-repeat domain/Abnormal spindle-like microcephaly-assoc'd, ASPM-SPD-2-Hydin
MAFSVLRQRPLVAALCALFALIAIPTSAQQITYYNFNVPATASPAQYSYACSAASPASNPFFCFDYAGGYFSTQGASPAPLFIQDPASSGVYATQMTYPAGSQATSMWFSIPQKVAEGFNVWFQLKITPTGNSGNTADGLAFVIQNAQGGGTDVTGSCSETGSGATVVGGAGGCIGYGGIDNSLALEFDTFYNSNFGDPDALSTPSFFTYNDNHMALQDCGAGVANSPDHNACQISLNGVGTLTPNPKSSSSGNVVTLADGNVHDVVIVYNGPLDTPANTFSVYLDPQYNTGTHTPIAGSVPVFTGSFDITQAINLLNSGSANDSAYVGFTSGTGADFETHEIMDWTFTPHTTVSEQQPLNPPGTPTTFNFGTHTYSVNYPSGGQTDGISMGVIASTISPLAFSNLIGVGPTQYSGSACQVYDDTGGNCIIYSVYCYQTGSPSSVVPCPAAQNPPPTDCSNPSATDCIDVMSNYDNSVQPTSPGFLKGDPLYSPVASINEQGITATITCMGECASQVGETITVLDVNNNPLPGLTNVTVTTANSTTPNVITVSTPNGPTGTVNGGFLTSNNVQDIFQSYEPGSLDGSTTGKIPSYSDFSVTAVTVIGSQVQLSAPNNNGATENEAETLTATVSAPANGGPNNLLLLLPAGSPGDTLGGTVSFTDNNGAVANCQNLPLTAVVTDGTTTYQAQCSYTPTAIGPDSINAYYSGDSYHQPSSAEQTLNVSPQTAQVTVGTSPAGLSYAVNGVQSNAAQTLTWNVGTNYTLFAPSVQTLPSTPNTQYVFSYWSNGVSQTTTATDVVPAPSTTASYTAYFGTQYLLDATASPVAGGTVAIQNGGNNQYYPASSKQTLIATANPGYIFSSWTGSSDISSPSASATTITMNAPELVTANFTAVPVASISPTSINLGTLYLGSIVTKTITITNTGAASMTISDPLIAIVPGANGNLSEFITINLCPKTLAVGKSCIMTVTFIAGPFYGTQNATLSINDNVPGSPQTIPLSATVIDPQASFSPASVSFGTEKVGTATASKPITLSNPGGTTLSIDSIAIAGTDPGDYSITSNTCTSSLTAGKSCTISVAFKPTAKGARTASLVVIDNTQSGTQNAALTGTGD